MCPHIRARSFRNPRYKYLKWARRPRPHSAVGNRNINMISETYDTIFTRTDRTVQTVCKNVYENACIGNKRARWRDNNTMCIPTLLSSASHCNPRSPKYLNLNHRMPTNTHGLYSFHIHTHTRVRWQIFRVADFTRSFFIFVLFYCCVKADG